MKCTGLLNSCRILKPPVRYWHSYIVRMICAILITNFMLLVVMNNPAQAQEVRAPQTGSASATTGATKQQRRGANEERDRSSPGGSITGRVLGDDGQPLANIAVNVWSRSAITRGNTTSTDENGQFRVNNLDPGAYNVAVFHPSYVMEPDPTAEPNQRPFYRIGDTVTIRMMRGGVVTGTVTGTSGEPVSGVRVRAIRVRNREGSRLSVLVWTRERQTDDRGVYRLYGLEPGSYIIMVGGSTPGFMLSAYDSDVPTYFPSSTQDTAAEVMVQSGQEVAGVDIRYRGEPGHIISGVISGGADVSFNQRPISIELSHAGSNMIVAGAPVFPLNDKYSFSFDGVADGDYNLSAMRYGGPNEDAFGSLPLRVTVRGADVTGVNLTLVPLGSISGRLNIEVAREAERKSDCASQRGALPEEVVVVARRDEQNLLKDQPRSRLFSSAEISPDTKGDFTLRNLSEGRYRINVRLPVEDWYVRSVSLPAAPIATSSRGAPAKQADDAARSGLMLKSGQRFARLTITVADGAASLRG